VSRATPAALGFRWPAEWEPHAATWLAWPHNTSDWPGKFAPIPWVYAEIVRALAPGEQVRIVVRSKAQEVMARRVLEKAGVPAAGLTFLRHPTNPTNWAITAATSATSGITTIAVANFDSTVSASDSGSDFQNSTLRSRRSAYSESIE
jgi:agmatine deiminase